MQEQLHKNKDSKSVDIFPKQNEFQGSPLPASTNTTATNNKLRRTNIFLQTTCRLWCSLIRKRVSSYRPFGAIDRHPGPSSRHPFSRNFPSRLGHCVERVGRRTSNCWLTAQSLGRSHQLAPGSSRFFSRRGLTALVAIEYLSIAWEGSLNTLDESDGPDSQTLFHLHRAGANHVQSQQAIRLQRWHESQLSAPSPPYLC